MRIFELSTLTSYVAKYVNFHKTKNYLIESRDEMTDQKEKYPPLRFDSLSRNSRYKV